MKVTEGKCKHPLGRVATALASPAVIDAVAPYVQGFAVSAPFGNVETALAVLKKIKIHDD